MNLRYLGDALDHWKGSLLARLRDENLLAKLAADAMAADGPQWTPSDWELLSKLIRLPRQHILEHTASLETQRVAYFEEINHASDIFLDPDTGIATGRVAKPAQYITPPELCRILDVNPSRVVAVYQHVRAVPTRDRIKQIIAALPCPGEPLSCCSDESSTVAMLFFSRNRHRIEEIHQNHAAFLGQHASRRTCSWHSP
jgi:hypothetical protein